MKLLAGNSNLPLVKDIAAYLDLPITAASVRRFADEEIFVEILDNVRGEDVFVVQSTSYPANDNLTESLIGIDRLRGRAAHGPVGAATAPGPRPAAPTPATRASDSPARRWGGQRPRRAPACSPIPAVPGRTGSPTRE